MDVLRKEFAHHISLKQKFDRDVEKQYTCFMHGFHVFYSEEVKSILRTNHKIIFGTEFVQGLIDRNILLPNKNGLLVIYFRNGNPVHAGKFLPQKNRVASKWGIGHLWEHDIWEVPAFYGDRNEFFNLLEQEKVIREFKEFAAKEKLEIVPQ